MHHFAADRERAAQDGGGQFRAAGGESVAYAGRGAFDPVRPGLGGDDPHLETVSDAQHGQALGVRRTVLAEGEVEADRNLAHAQAVDQHPLYKALWRKARHLGVEGQAIDALDPEGRERAGLLIGVGQAEGRGLGHEPAAGVGAEGDHAQGRAHPLGGFGGGGDHRPVAVMHAVEGAERDGRALHG